MHSNPTGEFILEGAHPDYRVMYASLKYIRDARAKCDDNTPGKNTVTFDLELEKALMIMDLQNAIPEEHAFALMEKYVEMTEALGTPFMWQEAASAIKDLLDGRTAADLKQMGLEEFKKTLLKAADDSYRSAMATDPFGRLLGYEV